ncbi:putative thioesterase superfamily protein [gamma proteobacterium HdN1]|nr:putative thioesterase superfamily protein [gamma proteobacterium HdN1]
MTTQTIALPCDTNADGDINGGWVVNQMDLAGASVAQRIAGGRVATVAMDTMVFLRPILPGSTVSCYCKVGTIGRSSITIHVDVWACGATESERKKITDGQFTFVAIDANRHTRAIVR